VTAISPQDDLPGTLCDGEERHSQGPGIGVAFPKWSLARLRNRVTDSIKRSAGSMTGVPSNIFYPYLSM